LAARSKKRFFAEERAVAFLFRWHHVLGMSALEIQKMPRQEKLKLVEALWADLSRDESDFESPAWHADALRETSERRGRGGETVMDWEEAK
jgi:hypothetical protein